MTTEKSGSHRLKPGADGDKVPSNVCVFRVGKNCHLNPVAQRQAAAHPALFELSSEDKKSKGQRLSIWIEELTIADQAWEIMGAKPDNTIVACFNVEAVRGINPPEGFSRLDVEWEKAMVNGSPDRRPGAKGHVGISGLNQGGGGKGDKNKRKQLRSKLADIATISPVPVPHDIEESHIQLAAYYLSADPDQRTPSPESDWIEAIRQLRRERVRNASGRGNS